MSEIFTEIDNLLAEEPPLKPIPVSPGQLTIPFAADETAAAGVSLLAPEFVTPLVVLGMIAGATAWLRPMFKAQTKGHQNLLWKAVNWTLKRIEHGIHTLEHRILHAMSHWLAPKIRPVTHFLNSTTHIVHTLTQDVGDLADNTHEAFVWLRHHVVPLLVHEAVEPLAKGERVLARAVDSINSHLQTAATEIATQLSYIGKTVGKTFTAAIGQLAVTVRELWNYVHHTIAPQLQALQFQVKQLAGTVANTFNDVYGDLYPRLQKVEALLAPAAFLAAVTAALSTSFGYLTCRNTKTAGTQLCAMDENLLGDVMALLAGAFILSDLRTYVRIMQEITEGSTTLVHELLQV